MVLVAVGGGLVPTSLSPCTDLQQLTSNYCGAVSSYITLALPGSAHTTLILVLLRDKLYFHWKIIRLSSFLEISISHCRHSADWGSCRNVSTMIERNREREREKKGKEEKENENERERERGVNIQ